MGWFELKLAVVAAPFHKFAGTCWVTVIWDGFDSSLLLGPDGGTVGQVVRTVEPGTVTVTVEPDAQIWTEEQVLSVGL